LSDTLLEGCGCLYGVGVGPGDPELLTLKAVRVLQQAPVVIAPRKTSRDQSYAYSIVSHLVDEDRQEVLPLVFPMKKDLGILRAYWKEACDAIFQRLASGKDCAFLTEGDPLLFGTFIYIFDMLKELNPGVKIEIVPGISSINASAACTQTPLASGDDRLAVLPATYEGAKLRATLLDFDTVVLLKVHSVFDQVLDILEELDLARTSVYIKRVSSPSEEIVRDISKLRGQKLDYLSLLIVRRPR